MSTALFVEMASWSRRIPRMGRSCSALLVLKAFFVGATSKKALLTLTLTPKGHPCNGSLGKPLDFSYGQSSGHSLLGHIWEQERKAGESLAVGERSQGGEEEGTGSFQAAERVCTRLLPSQDNFRKPVKATGALNSVAVMLWGRAGHCLEGREMRLLFPKRRRKGA